MARWVRTALPWGRAGGSAAQRVLSSVPLHQGWEGLMRGRVSICGNSDGDELAGNVRGQPFRSLSTWSRLAQHRKGRAEKRSAARKNQQQRASPFLSSQVWLGRGQRGTWGSAEGKPSSRPRAASNGRWCGLCRRARAALLRPGWAADEEFPGAENIKLTFLWDDQSPGACCLRGAR